MKYLKFILIGAGAGMLIYSCSKSLQKSPLGQLDAAELANRRGVEGLLIGAYSLLDGEGGNKSDYTSAASNWIYGSICGTEAYKGSFLTDQEDPITPLETFQPTATNYGVASKWGTVYDGVQRSNDVLRMMKLATDISDDDQKRISAEVRFLRAHYHFEAKKMWNKVPYIDETITFENNNYHVTNQVDIWPDIENDLKYAVDNLPEMPYQGAVGRAVKFTAMALLAKAYIFQKKYDSARPLLQAIISSGKYQLVPYANNFNPGTKNNAESVFSVQMSVNDGSVGLNGNYGDVNNFPVSPNGPGTCCGFFQPSQYLVNHFKTDSITGLPDLDHFNDKDVTSDEALQPSDPFSPYSGSLDSRLDWTIGRRSIPYLDWGIMTGTDWVRDPVDFGSYVPKKNVYYKYQQTHLTDAQFWGNVTTANNVNLIRYADVLLWAAEVEVETGDLNIARDYVNQVRSRAADSTGWVKNPDGSPAANYYIGLYTGSWTDQSYARKAVRYERMLEFGMEGHRFFDLVRWGIAETEINGYLQKEMKKRTYLNAAVFSSTKNQYFPIPQAQIDLSAGADGKDQMIQNPGY